VRYYKLFLIKNHETNIHYGNIVMFSVRYVY